MSFQDKTTAILQREQEIEERLAGVSDPREIAKLSKELSDLRKVCVLIRAYQEKLMDKASLEDLLSDSDSAISRMAEDEIPANAAACADLEKAIRVSLLPRDAADEKDVIMEIRAGTGGDEAALFVSSLLKMYLGYAEGRSWRSEILSANESDLGGYKEVIARITGNNVYFRMRFESGVHRVQRVPATEASGRIHTSAATVAVLPEAGDIDVSILPGDLRIDTMRSGGAGGQHVNKTESAVRITHEATGISVVVQEERSQHKNKAKALSIIRARLYDLERMRQGNDRAADRKGQVGSGDRSERIRTYNFPQGRVTDHRIGLTLYKLDKILSGEGLEEMIDGLIVDHQARLLASGA